jgi:metal-responsive CopG/Arc/MetJ family transcriptional regulator
VTARLPDELVTKIETFAAQEGDTRSTAIRRLVEIGLGATTKAQRTAKSVLKASDMAAQQIDRLADRSATAEERHERKRRLIKGPKEFRDIRSDHPRPKR